MTLLPGHYKTPNIVAGSSFLARPIGSTRMIAVPEMEKKKAPISMLAVIQRINVKLAAKGQILKTRPGNWLKRKRYYIVDLSGTVMDPDIDPEELARKLGLLKEGRRVKSKKKFET
jgi:hypothetical protein